MDPSSGAANGRTVTVKPGDTLVSIAHAEGFRSWEAIYYHPSNGELRRRRPNPEQLFPGDVVVIPEKVTPLHTRPTGKSHVFRAPRLVAHLRFTVGDETDVYAGSRYVIAVDGAEQEGVTDDRGLVDVEVSPSAKRALVKVWPSTSTSPDPVEWEIAIGHLDPMDEPSGLRGRLVNLGYDVGSGGIRSALLDLQADHGLAQTGELDDTTRALVRRLHGG